MGIFELIQEEEIQEKEPDYLHNDYVSYSYSSDYSYTQASSLELESLLTEAINYVTEEKTPVIYTLTGHAEKQQVDMMVHTLLPAAGKLRPDAADALAAAICHSYMRVTAERMKQLAELIK